MFTLLLCSSAINADQLTLSIGSHHFISNNIDYPFNEVNPGVGYVSDNNYIFGAFHNSYDGLTLYAGKRFERSNFGIEIGVASYENYLFYGGRPIIPVIHITVDIDSIRFGLTPGDIETVYTTLTIQYVIQR